MSSPRTNDGGVRQRRPQGAWLLLTLCGSLAAIALDSRRLGAHDAATAHAFVVGPGAALAACELIDASDSSRARSRLPRAPGLAFRTRLPGGIGQAPASDGAGNVIIVHGEPRISKLDAQGRTLWSERLPSEPTTAPVLTSDGSIFLVTRDADALFIDALGKVVRKRGLPLAEQRHRSLAIPTLSGGAFVASGTVLVEIDARGEIARQAHAPSNVTGIAESSSGLITISEAGAVARGHATGDFEFVANLGGVTPDGGAVQAGRLFAIVDGHKLVVLDLSTGSVLVLANDSVSALSGPPALFADHRLVVIADGGFLSLRAANGAETLRASLTAGGPAFDPAARSLRPALAITDPGGAIAAVRSGGDALILSADGKAQRVDGTSCLDPFRPTPTLAGVIFACRSGQLFGVSDRAP